MVFRQSSTVHSYSVYVKVKSVAIPESVENASLIIDLKGRPYRTFYSRLLATLLGQGISFESKYPKLKSRNLSSST